MKVCTPNKSIFRTRNTISSIAVLLFASLTTLLPVYNSVSGNGRWIESSDQNAKGEKRKGAPSRKTYPYAKLRGDGADSARPVLATADFNLIGLAITASPASQTVPKNTPTVVQTTMQAPFGTDPQEIISELNPNLRIRGELIGPSLTSPITIEAKVGEPLAIPALSRSGDHVLQNLRVVDTGAEGSPVIAVVTPDLCSIAVIDQILVSEVRVQELTYEQIIQSGISITDDSYRFFNFVLAVATSSTTVNVNLPVAFPDLQSEDPRPVIGRPSSPPQPGVDIPIIDAVPVMLEVEEEAASGIELKFDDKPIRIPGLVVFPGRIGFLNQFFEAIVIVSNGAPAGAPLIVRNLHVRVKLPDNGTSADTSDDPLRIAVTQTGGAISELEVRGLGPDGKYGTADDLTRFSPGQAGQATFLLEGLKEGLHTPVFELEGTLEGLPIGPVTVRGEVPGAVLVRNASFAVTFSHPSIVRAGNEYELAMTIYNSGNRDINGAIVRLSPAQINGASLKAGDNGDRAFATTIPQKGSSTVTWRLRSNTTGAVSASYLKVGDGIEAGLVLTTGIGDRNVPLSPESLILPDEVRFLPFEVVEAGRSLLGQAWSVASAPRGSLPSDVIPITKQAVIDRAIEMGMAGLRVEFGEAVEVSLLTLERDWLGELQANLDEGFADALRNTTSGFNFHDAIGKYLHKRLTTEPPLLTTDDLHTRLIETESPRSSFISALVTQADGEASFGARLVDPSGRKIGFINSLAERAGEIYMGAALRLDGANASLGQMLITSRPVDGNWFIEISAWKNSAIDISVVVPANASTYRRILFSAVQIVEGRQYRIKVRPGSTATPALEEFSNGTYKTTAAQPLVTSINQPSARLVGGLQVSAEVMSGGDRYGRLVGLLFSRPMQKSSAEQPSHYRIGRGELIGSDPPSVIGSPINVRSATLQLGGRFVFLALNAPVGPYIRRDVTVTNVNDTRGVSLSASPVTSAITATVSPEGRPPGAVLTGRVLQADGTAVANASVSYWTQPCKPGEAPALITVQKTDGEGRYAIDYVRNGDCGGVVITAVNPSNDSQKRLSTSVVYDGQHLSLDMVFLARGNARGRVTVGGAPAPFSFVRIVPHLDASITPTVQTDSLGRYEVDDLPVGQITVFAVGTGSLSIATGIGAGSIDGPGQTATVDVSLQNTSGTISGKVINSDDTPSVGSLVLARAHLPGFESTDPQGLPVGFAITGRDGSFSITGLPLSEIGLEVKDYVTDLSVRQIARLSQGTIELDGVVITLPGFGSISGKVTDEDGNFIPFVKVHASGSEFQADALGNYLIANLRVGTYKVTATETASGATGEAVATVTANQTTGNVNITITRPGTITGQVFLLDSSGQSLPVSNAIVTHDGITQVTTDSQGRYRLRNIRANTLLTLRFIHPNNRLGVNIDTFVAPGETITRNVTFKSASLRGRIFQPDGVIGTVADITIFAFAPSFQPGGGFGILELKETTTQSSADGAYSAGLLNPGAYRVRASNAFFPTRVSKGGVLTQGEDEVCNLTLVNTLAGKIQGRVFQPDGITPAGANINVTLGGGSLADVRVKTDSNGHYEFAEVFAESIYTLTATDPATGFTNRITISARINEDTIADIKLLGHGNLHLRIIDGGGAPVTSATITVDGIAHPKHHRFAEIDAESGGEIEFTSLSEGVYSLLANQNGLTGRASVTVITNSVAEVTIQLQASGIVEGRVVMPDSITTVGLADVSLLINNHIVGVTTTSDEAGQTGHFTFSSVPAGLFTLEAFDNRTGRTGRATGTITAQGETVEVDIKLTAVGAVTGVVTQNGEPVDHALVSITANGGVRLQATTTSDGRYRFTGIPVGSVSISVSDGPGGLTGYAMGQVAGTSEPLPDTVINISLQPSVTITGSVFRFGGAERVAGARVTLQAGSRVIETTSDQSGRYRIEFAPLGDLIVRAEAPAGFDRGQSPVTTATQPGEHYVIDVTLIGTGNVSGNALDSNGSMLSTGTMTYTNVSFGAPIVLVGQVEPNGRYEIRGAPAGEFSLKLVVPGRSGVGVASSTIVANHTIELPVRMEDAGTVLGKIIRPDSTTPAASADIVLTLRRGAMSFNLFAHSSAVGNFRFDNVPLGDVSLRISDPSTGGIASVSGMSLNVNGQTLDVGTIVLDNSPIRVESTSPANGETNVTRNTQIIVTFSEPALESSIHQSTIRLLKVQTPVANTISLSTDGRIATLTPSTLLEDFTTYTIIVTTAVKDGAGIPLEEEFRTSFVTRDEMPPVVTSVNPQNNAAQVTLDSSITVTFNEPLDPVQDFSGVIRLFASDDQLTSMSGDIALDDTGRIATLRPAQPLAESTLYTIKVTGQRDRFGNIQTDVFTSSFATIDRTSPVIDPLPVDGTVQITRNPIITATYRDNLVGINVASLILKLDEIDITSSAAVTENGLSFQPSSPLALGVHLLSLQVSDNAGNTAMRSASFTVDETPPLVTDFKIGGVAAVQGMTVASTLQPLFEADYTDISGIDTQATRLLLGPAGTTPVQVAATVTESRLTFLPASNMLEGQYVVELIVVDKLGNTATTGQIEFNLDADAPEILAVTPASGNQHGGTTVTITGARLLNTNGTAPTVFLAGRNIAVSSATAGNPDTLVFVTPAAAPGPAAISVSTDRGTLTLPGGFNYEADPRTPFATESDTRLLWHLDEAGTGAVQVIDSGPISINGKASSSSLAASGRFAGGRTRPLIQANADFGALSFGSSSFSVECWIKTGPVGLRTILAGKTNGFGGNEEYTFDIEPSGVLRGKVVSSAGVLWQAEMAATVIDVDNNQWHSIAMVVDREQGKLKLYVDGEERANANEPASFGAVRSQNNSLFVGFTPNSSFNGALDEVRISSSAHSADTIRKTYLGAEGDAGLVVTRITPSVVVIGTTTEIAISGYNLSGITSELTDAAGLSVPTQIITTSATLARIRISAAATATPGPAKLFLSSDAGTATLTIPLVDLNRVLFQPESDTQLLWHLDEAGNGAVRVLDSGPFAIGGRASGSSIATSGRFAGGRSKPLIQADADFGALSFGSSSFSVECWIKTGPVGQRTILVGRTNGFGGSEEYTLEIQPSGALRGKVINVAGVLWQVEMAATVINVADNQWHSIAMVVDREQGKLKLYVDGEERASANEPTEFGAVRSQNNPLFVGFMPTSSFNGVLDEVRISSSAHSPEKIRNTWFGMDSAVGLNLKPPQKATVTVAAIRKESKPPLRKILFLPRSFPSWLIPDNDAASMKGGRR